MGREGEDFAEETAKEKEASTIICTVAGGGVRWKVAGGLQVRNKIFVDTGLCASVHVL